MAIKSVKVRLTQAEIERAIRAAKAEGLSVERIILRTDGCAIETAPSVVPGADDKASKIKPVL